MKNFKIAAVAAFALALIVPVMAQSKMDDHKMAQNKMGGKMMGSKMGKMHQGMMSKKDMMDHMMMGLSADEKKTAMAHMAKMTPAEKAAMMKCTSMCMKDSAKMKSMPKSEMEMQKRMMMHLSKGEQATMKGMMSKMTPDEKAVSKKMMANCCMPMKKMGKMQHGKM
jgi:hypothetical protein